MRIFNCTRPSCARPDRSSAINKGGSPPVCSARRYRQTRGITSMPAGADGAVSSTPSSPSPNHGLPRPGPAAEPCRAGGPVRPSRLDARAICGRVLNVGQPHTLSPQIIYGVRLLRVAIFEGAGTTSSFSINPLPIVAPGRARRAILGPLPHELPGIRRTLKMSR